MSYGRHPFYIVSHGTGVSFYDSRELGAEERHRDVHVHDDMLDAWLYVMLLGPRRQELIERLRHGRTFWPQDGNEDWITKTLLRLHSEKSTPGGAQ